MAKGLTKRQEEILEFVKDYSRQEGYPPSIREIGSKFEISSLRGVTVHLDALARKGYISRANTPRSIKVTHPEHQPKTDMIMLPILGTIAAGAPILAVEEAEETMAVPPEKVRGVSNAFLLRVQGDSMTGDGIIDGDLVIIKPQETWSENDIVAVVLDDSATLKRVRKTPSGPQLIASNPAYAPIPVDTENARVIGKAIGLMRDF
jgi:repressor LexA